MNYYFSVDMDSFYNSPTKINFSNISLQKQLILRATSIYLNNCLKKAHSQLSLGMRYTKMMNRIKSNPKEYFIDNPSEMYLLFMFTVDPNFDALVIREISNNEKEVKKKLTKLLGLYDSNLIRLEIHYMNVLASQKTKNKIKEKVYEKIY